MHSREVKFFNPETSQWELINILIDKKLNYDYADCTWVALDGEFTGLYPQRDKSTLWTIASKDKDGNYRAECLYTYNDDADLSDLKQIISNPNIEKYFFYGKLDLAFLYKLTGIIVSSPIYDLKIASIITRTHTQAHNINNLVETYINAEEKIINKSSIENADWVTDYTEWTDETYQYNLNDVIYLNFLSEKIKDIAKASQREDIVDAANKALPYIGVIYANGFYRDIFKHGYKDSDLQG